MARIFISYKRVDKDIVFKIKDRIKNELGEKCWVDVDGIESDAQFKNVIIKAIKECEIVLFMYSKAHLKITDFEKDWTVRELNFATKKNKRIVFINLDNSPLIDTFEFDFGTKQQVDGTSDQALSRLTQDLKNWLEETDRKRKEEEDRIAKEEAERKAQEEAERKAQEEAEREAREEAIRKAQEEAERETQEEAERETQGEEERIAREEAWKEKIRTTKEKAGQIADIIQRSLWQLTIVCIICFIVLCIFGLYRFSTNNTPSPDNVTNKTIVNANGHENKGTALVDSIIPNPPSPPRLLVDYTGALHPDFCNQMDSCLTEYASQTSNQIAVVVVNDLKGFSISHYAIALGKKWGVGLADKNNGVVVLIKTKTAQSKGEIFIATGTRLESILPDSECERIIDECMIKHLRQDNNYENAIRDGVNEIIKVLNEQKAKSL